MTREEFTKIVGHPPIEDQLDLTNCQESGIEHMFCGICEHGKPVLACQPCSLAKVKATLSQLPSPITK